MSLRGVLLLDLEQRDPRVKPRPSPWPRPGTRWAVSAGHPTAERCESVCSVVSYTMCGPWCGLVGTVY